MRIANVSQSKPGAIEVLEPGIRRIVAPNPSPMTYTGTNTYLIGTSDLAVIDPGPANEKHLRSVLNACAPDQRITHIIVTHSHMDHSGNAKALAKATGAEIWAFGDSLAGRSKAMTALVQTGFKGGGEGVDRDFCPDRIVRDGDEILGSDWRLQVIHTPGHMGNHICLAYNNRGFTGDHVMGWATSMVSPPDGDLSDFIASCRKLQSFDWTTFYPGHGDPVFEPDKRLRWLVDHRLEREQQILETLALGSASASEITQKIYSDLPAHLQPAAKATVIAHLIALLENGSVTCEASGIEESRVRLSNEKVGP